MTEAVHKQIENWWKKPTNNSTPEMVLRAKYLEQKDDFLQTEHKDEREAWRLHFHADGVHLTKTAQQQRQMQTDTAEEHRS